MLLDSLIFVKDFCIFMFYVKVLLRYLEFCSKWLVEFQILFEFKLWISRNYFMSLLDLQTKCKVFKFEFEFELGVLVESKG